MRLGAFRRPAFAEIRGWTQWRSSYPGLRRWVDRRRSRAVMRSKVIKDNQFCKLRRFPLRVAAYAHNYGESGIFSFSGVILQLVPEPETAMKVYPGQSAGERPPRALPDVWRLPRHLPVRLGSAGVAVVPSVGADRPVGSTLDDTTAVPTILAPSFVPTLPKPSQGACRTCRSLLRKN